MSETLVRTDSGTLGYPAISQDVRAYRGIPYAAPPVGPLRWRPPQAPEAWDGVRRADRFGHACYQPHLYGDSVMNLLGFDQPAEAGMSEDCLYLNVWTTGQKGDDRPVIVYIYGGGNRVGAGSHPIYDGTALCRKGAVVVTMNYRVGALGFLAHPLLSVEDPEGASGNYGVMDIIAALRWVRNNIAAFGGDPNCVTIMGESAGAGHVSALMASPKARGLFHRAAAFSGGRFDGGLTGKMKLLDAALDHGREHMEKFAAKTAEDLRNVPIDQMFGGRNIYDIVVDGRVLTESVHESFRSGSQAMVPLLTGFNSEDSSPYPRRDLHSAKALRAHAETQGNRRDAFLSIYPADDDGTAKRSSYAMVRDFHFAWQPWIWARLHRASAQPVWMSYFVQSPPLRPDVRLREYADGERPGAFHGADLFYWLHTMQPQKFAWSDEDHHLADQMTSILLRFAAQGDPGGGELPQWPRFATDEAAVMWLGSEIAARPLPNQAGLAFYEFQ